MFSFRPTFILCLSLFLFSEADAQLVDGVLGQKQTVVQVLLRPHRIVDYKKERVVHSIDQGIQQTVMYENDTCNRFYWAVSPDKMDYFTNLLLESGYKRVGDDGFVKDSLKINVKPLKSGKATLFIADLTAEMKQMQRVVYQQKMQKPTGQEPLPLLQQAILAEERDTTAKPPKDPQRHWVGRKKGRATILGWE